LSLSRALGRALLPIALSACMQALEVAYAAEVANPSCRSDAECPGGFCDNGTCAAMHGVFGAACTPAPRTPEGIRDGKLHSCGPYVCSDTRCRSCSSDEQCRAELGAPFCVLTSGLPGRRCGR
jgi:hypothetical protein